MTVQLNIGRRVPRGRLSPACRTAPAGSGRVGGSHPGDRSALDRLPVPGNRLCPETGSIRVSADVFRQSLVIVPPHASHTQKTEKRNCQQNDHPLVSIGPGCKRHEPLGDGFEVIPHAGALELTSRKGWPTSPLLAPSSLRRKTSV